MGSITSAGIGSGLDLEGIINAFVNAERIPTQNRINTRELEVNTKLSGVGTLKANLKNFQDTLEKLSDPNEFGKRSVSFSDGKDIAEQPISVTTTAASTSGNFDVTVQQIAQGSSFSSAALGASTDPLGSGNLTFGDGTDSFGVTIGAADTLADIRDKINSASGNTFVNANIINSDSGAVLIFDSSTAGLGNDLTVVSDDDSLASIATSAPTLPAGLISTQTASSAQLLVNGQTVTSDSNEFEDIIEGSTITISSAAKINDNTGFSVDIDKASVEELIDDFVSGFNALSQQLSTLSNAKSGSLAFDTDIRQIEQQFNRFLTQDVASATGDIQALFDIGIAVNQIGELEINDLATVPGALSGRDRLNNSLANNFDEITTLFSADDGIAKQFNDYLEEYTKSNGLLEEREDSLNITLDDLQDQREDLSLRLEGFEQTLRLQYTALDQTIAQFNSTGAFLTSFLANNNNNDN